MKEDFLSQFTFIKRSVIKTVNVSNKKGDYDLFLFSHLNYAKQMVLISSQSLFFIILINFKFAYHCISSIRAHRENINYTVQPYRIDTYIRYYARTNIQTHLHSVIFFNKVFGKPYHLCALCVCVWKEVGVEMHKRDCRPIYFWNSSVILRSRITQLGLRVGSHSL